MFFFSGTNVNDGKINTLIGDFFADSCSWTFFHHLFLLGKIPILRLGRGFSSQLS